MKKFKWPLIGLGVLLIIIAIMIPMESEQEKKEETVQDAPAPSSAPDTQEQPKVMVVPKSPQVKEEDIKDAKIVE